jgi:hypothetical protein
MHGAAGNQKAECVAANWSSWFVLNNDGIQEMVSRATKAGQGAQFSPK